MNHSITSIPGVRVGHYTNAEARTGCSVILFDRGIVCGVDVRGAAPGTRETVLLKGYHLVNRINAVLLTGGSAYGLDAAAGIMQYLEEKRVGYGDPNGVIVPIVPGAVLYDLEVGDSKIRPQKADGYRACETANADPVENGCIGAGTGATIGKCFGMQHAVRGGLGNAVVELPGGVKVAAMIAVNALGDVYDHRTGQRISGAVVDGNPASCYDALLGGVGAGTSSNTTIGILVTNAKLTREEANRLALIGHDGLAMSIRPVHTPMDGDTLFAASTGELDCPNHLSLFAAAAEAAALAVENAVKNHPNQR